MIRRKKNIDTATKHIILEGLLSHRIRGFGQIESSIPALEKALQSEIKYIEVDTRHTVDDQILIFHDHLICDRNNSDIWIKDKTLDEIKEEKFEDRIQLASLEEMLIIFRNSNSNAKFCIDIKDPGLSEVYCQYIRKYCLEERVVFISWIPEILKEIHYILPKVPLIFSYHPITSLIKIILKGIISLNNFMHFSKIVEVLTDSYRFKVINTLLPFFDCYDRSANSLTGRLGEKGWGHTHFITGLPTGDLLNILIESQGGVCVPKYSITNSFRERANYLGLQVWVFTINHLNRLIEYIMRVKPDVIFTDKADELLYYLSKCSNKNILDNE